MAPGPMRLLLRLLPRKAVLAVLILATLALWLSSWSMMIARLPGRDHAGLLAVGGGSSSSLSASDVVSSLRRGGDDAVRQRSSGVAEDPTRENRTQPLGPVVSFAIRVARALIYVARGGSCLSAVRGQHTPRTGSSNSSHEVPRRHGVVFLNTRKHFSWHNTSVRNKRQYCERHGYFCHDGSNAASKAPRGKGGGGTELKVKASAWHEATKLKVLTARAAAEACPDCEWILYLDIDTVIMNLDVSITDLLGEHAGGDAFFLVAADSLSLNTGAWLVRNDDRGLGFLRAWEERQPRFRTNQQALNSLYNERRRLSGQACEMRDDDLSSPSSVKPCLSGAPVPGVAVVPLCRLASWGGLEWAPGTMLPFWSGAFVEGDFSVHFAGIGARKKVNMERALSGWQFWQ